MDLTVGEFTYNYLIYILLYNYNIYNTTAINVHIHYIILHYIILILYYITLYYIKLHYIMLYYILYYINIILYYIIIILYYMILILYYIIVILYCIILNYIVLYYNMIIILLCYTYNIRKAMLAFGIKSLTFLDDVGNLLPHRTVYTWSSPTDPSAFISACLRWYVNLPVGNWFFSGAPNQQHQGISISTRSKVSISRTGCVFTICCLSRLPWSSICSRCLFTLCGNMI